MQLKIKEAYKDLETPCYILDKKKGLLKTMMN